MYTKEIILSYLSSGLAKRLSGLDAAFFEEMTELRVRADKPLFAYCLGKEHEIEYYRPSTSDIAETMERISRYSLYALEEELRMGYVTLPGGHRVGVVGKAVAEGGVIKTIRPICGLNIRISRPVKGAADPVLPLIMDCQKLPHNTMIISPPGCGKTTLLRDIIRQLSDKKHLTIGVADERSEIGGSYRGVAQNDVGLRTDLLDGCPKAEGMLLLLRSMAPQVIAVDELGGKEDIGAVENISNAGVRLLCTVHGYNIENIRQKPNLRTLLDMGVFKRYVVLEFPGGPCEVLQQEIAGGPCEVLRQETAGGPCEILRKEGGAYDGN